MPADASRRQAQLLEQALAHHRAGELAEAEAGYRMILAREPLHPQALHLMGCLAHQLGDNGAAAEHLGLAIAVRQDFPASHYALGLVRQSQGELEDAAASYRKALALQPGYAEAHNNLGVICQERGELAEASDHFRQALCSRPDYLDACINLGNVCKERMEHAAALAAFRQALAIDPGSALAHGNLLLAMNYHPGLKRAEIYAEHRRWAERHATGPPALQPDRHVAAVGRPLRLGYVSPDFRSHPVAFFIEPLLAHHDGKAFEIVCYANVARPDAVTERLRQLAPRWRDICGLSDEEAAELVRRDGIDILVDLAGHTAGNRLSLFARRPAPVQVTWLGYPNTTGLAAIDYRLTDAQADPPGTEAFFSEELVRLPQAFFCYRPPCPCPPVSPLPALAAGHVTFGALTNLAKVSPEVLSLWGRVLQAVPDSRLILQAKSLADEATRRKVTEAFAAQGIALERLELRGYLPFAEHLDLYRRIDVALDTFPWNGHTTTCHALWLGVPTVTLAGESHAARMGISILARIGLEKLIASSPEDFVAKAAALAGDQSGLQALRAELRTRMEKSPLRDEVGFTRALEESLQNMWRRRMESERRTPGSRRHLPQGLSVVMIGKNEEAMLPAVLTPLGQLADEIVFVDTGSEDRTVELARAYGCRVFHFQWCQDFSKARNFGLDKAAFRWILSVDCDEVIDLKGARKSLERLLAAEDKPAYILEREDLVENGRAIRTEVLRLFRNDPRLRFRNPVHESVCEALFEHWPRYLPEKADLRLLHYGYVNGSNRAKTLRNLQILERWVASVPDNIFAHYKMGQTRLALGEKEKALESFAATFRLLDGSGQKHTYPFAQAFLKTYHQLLVQHGDLQKAGELAARVESW